MMRQRAVRRLVVAAAMLVGSAGTAFAQLDPLLFMKTAQPNVLLVVDTANRMQRDASNDYYDQYTYRTTGANWEAPIAVQPGSASYKRKYINLRHLDSSLNTDKFEVGSPGQSPGILTIANNQAGSNVCGNLVPPSFAAFDSCTRMAVARNAIARAITLNRTVVRFGFIPMRQGSPAVGTASPAGSPYGNTYPVKNNDPNQLTPTDYQWGKWRIMRPTVAGPNNMQAANSAAWCTPDAATCGTGADKAAPNIYLQTLFGRSPDQGGLIPAGSDAINYIDAPIKYMLDDAKTEATTLINADTMHRNTVVVLVVGGTEGALGLDPATTASAFLSLGTAKRRVPIYVIAVAPLDGATGQPVNDAGRQKLRDIATNSGGQYMEITADMINATTPGSPVPEFVRAINAAIQHTFAAETQFNTAPTGALPYGPSSEFQTTSPIIGTADLSNSVDINGNPLPYSVIYKGTNVIPQRSNVVVTTAVSVPGGDAATPSIDTPGLFGKLRAFRVYKPVPDVTKTAGYRFVADGTALWVARPPTSAEGQRNIYTVVDGTMVPFTADNAATLQPYMNTSDAAGVIDYVRRQPLGAFIDTTPAFLDAPSLDPPPDADYPGFKDLCEKRRTLIFIGGNDGMLHAIDARTGVEVWAFIPANLLPKLRALRSGQPVGEFRFFVDGSPKLADVKVGGQWRTYIVFGEGPGGTFYQTLDVTMSTLGTSVAPESSDVSALLGYFSDKNVIPFKWSFPSYSHFNYKATPAADYTSPYGTSSTYGDLDKDAATAVEKSVGQTWSDPAVGQVKSAQGSWVVLTGSGFLPYSQQSQPNRAGVGAGTTFYILDMATGNVLDSRNVGNDTTAEFIDACWISSDITKGSAGDCSRQKNALQSDPVATGPPNSRHVDTAYIGDLDGRLWRITLGLTSSNVATITAGPVKLFDAGTTHPLFSSMAVVNVGGTQQYVFFGTGSDLLPSTGVSQAYKLMSVLDQNGSGAQKFTYSMSAVGSAAEEKVSAYPAVAGDIVFFTTTTYKPATPWVKPDAAVYAFTFIGGPAYDNSGDNLVSSKDTPKVASFAAAGRATAPFVADTHVVLGVGGELKVLGDPQNFNNGVGQVGVRILSWREIR